MEAQTESGVEFLVTDYGECEIPPGSTPEQIQALANTLRAEAEADGYTLVV